MPRFMMMVNRELRRVPLDFDWQVGKIWKGYLRSCGDNECDRLCKGCEKIDPPKGDGFQCWETTSEGSPISPVFKTLDELGKWLSINRDFVGHKLSKEKWIEILKDSCPCWDMQENKIEIANKGLSCG